MPHVKVKPHRGEVSLYYELRGHGPEKVLLVMGFATTFRGWDPQIKFFSKFPEKYEICFFDNRGVGRSTVPEGRYKTSEMAEDAIDLVDHIGWKKFHVIGISMGGMISQELALRALPRILSLTLAVTHAGGFWGLVAPLEGILTLLKNARVKDPTTRSLNSQKILYSPGFLASTGSHGRLQRDHLLDVMVERINQDGIATETGLKGQVNAISTHYISKHRLKQLKDSGVPICVVAATADLLVRPRNSFMLNDHLSPAEFVVFEGCGHAVNVEREDDFNAALIRNIERGVRRAAGLEPSTVAAAIASRQPPADGLAAEPAPAAVATPLGETRHRDLVEVARAAVETALNDALSAESQREREESERHAPPPQEDDHDVEAAVDAALHASPSEGTPASGPGVAD